MASFSLSAKRVKKLRRAAGHAGVLATMRLDNRSTIVRGQWLAKDRRTPLGEAFTLDLPADAAMEAYLPDGALGHVAAVPGVQFEQVAPRGAQYLALGVGGTSEIVARATIRSPDPAEPEASRTFGPKDARFQFPVFAERFTDTAKFFVAVQALHDWIITVPPFDDPRIRDGFALRAHYWRTDPKVGQCNTPDVAYDCLKPPTSAVVLCGNNELAKAKFGHLMRDRKYGLVLIDSMVRGGAGGMADYGYPAWATTTACPREHWQAVALHEMGHALGLADEYLDPGRAGERSADEPNVAVSDAINGAQWSQRFSNQPPTAASCFSIDQQRTMHPPTQDFVGLFQGARYRTDYYRASYNCLMRATNWPQFCPVCATAIRAYFGL